MSPVLSELEDALLLLCSELMNFRAKQENIGAKVDTIIVDPAGSVGGVQV